MGCVQLVQLVDARDTPSQNRFEGAIRGSLGLAPREECELNRVKIKRRCDVAFPKARTLVHRCSQFGLVYAEYADKGCASPCSSGSPRRANIIVCVLQPIFGCALALFWR